MQKFLILLCLLFIMAGVNLAQDETLTPYDVALERIFEAERTGATRLDLSALGLTEVPPEIGILKNLKRLILDSNKLISLPREIEQLSKLESLGLSRNNLGDLPQEVFTLYNLRELYLNHNELISLPPAIGKLIRLNTLYLQENQLSDLPSEIGNLKELKWLYLYGNRLFSLPSQIGNLSNLCHLYLYENQLRELTYTIVQLQSLTNAMKGCRLEIGGNPLKSPPPEVIVQGTPAILDYLNHQAEWHLRRLVISAATGIGLLILLILGLRWRMGRKARKSKQKREFV